MPIHDWPQPFRVRRSSLHSAFAVSVSAAEAAYPLPPSSFSKRTRFAGLRFDGGGAEARSTPLSRFPSCCAAARLPGCASGTEHSHNASGCFALRSYKKLFLVQISKQRFAPPKSHAGRESVKAILSVMRSAS